MCFKRPLMSKNYPLVFFFRNGKYSLIYIYEYISRLRQKKETSKLHEKYQTLFFLSSLYFFFQSKFKPTLCLVRQLPKPLEVSAAFSLGY